MAVVTKMGKYLKGAAVLYMAEALAGSINLSAASPGQCIEITEISAILARPLKPKPCWRKN